MVSEARAPDGGWGWVVVIGSAVCQMLTIGVLWALSILYVSWLDEFDQSKGMTSWVISLGFSLLFGAGPISASLAARFGYRAVVIAGGVLTSAGILASFWASSVEFLIVAIGLFSGLGCGLVYVPAVAIVPVYFDRKRSLASGISLSGVSIGSFILAPLLEFLETSYGWRGTILILGALTLNIIVCGAVMRPLSFKTAADVNIAQKNTCNSHAEPPQEEQNNDNEYSKFISSEYENINDVQGVTKAMQIKEFRNLTEEFLSNSEIQTSQLKNGREDALLSIQGLNEMDEHSAFVVSSDKEERSSGRETQIETTPSSAAQANTHKEEQNVSNTDVQIALIKDNHDDVSTHLQEKLLKQRPLAEAELLRVAASRPKVSGSMHNLETSKEHHLLNLPEHKARSVVDLRTGHSATRNNDYPFMGSVQCFKNVLLASTPALSHADTADNLHKNHVNYSSKKSVCDSKVMTSCKLSSSKRKLLLILKENFREVIQTNKELMKDLPFMILAMSHMLLCIAAFTLSVYMVDRMVFEGIDKSLGAIIVSVTSAFNFLGRIFFGFAADGICKDHLALYIGTVGVSGVSTLLSPLCGSNVYLHGLYAAVVGFTTGGSSTLTFVVNVDVMGVARVASSYGLLLTFMGLGNLVGMPMAGWLFDWTQTYTIPYIIQGLSLVIADVMLVGLYVYMYKGRHKLTGSKVVVPET